MRFPKIALTAALTAACGGGDATAPATMTPPGVGSPASALVTTAALTESGPFVFQPEDVTVKLGGSVTWSVPEAAGVIRHSVTADSGGWAADTLAATQRLTKVFETRGDFRYHCVFHEGMVGKVRVR